MTDEPTFTTLTMDADEFEGNPEDLYCPVCRQKVTDIIPDESYEFTPCPHLLFGYVTIEGLYEFESPAFQKRMEAVDTENLEDDSFMGTLVAAGYGKDLALIEVAYSGMACGPIGYSVYLGFDCSTIDLAKEQLEAHRAYILEQSMKDADAA